MVKQLKWQQVKLTVKQTSNNDGAKVEFDLANDIKIVTMAKTVKMALTVKSA